jgi:prepilin-type N-terminal cleavage/methylation domain-containing protein
MGDITMARKTKTTSPQIQRSWQRTAGRTEAMALKDNSAGDLKSEHSQAGFTLTEIIVAMFIATLLMTIGVHLFQNQREKVELVKCMAEVRGIQAAVMNMGDGRYIPKPQYFWDNTWPDGRKHGPYYYIVDGDPNSGHGNDLDGVDEENPGASDPDKKDIKFVIFCEHDHGDLGKYVYLTDEEPPTVVHGDGDDPDYSRFIKWEYGGPGAGNGKK